MTAPTRTTAAELSAALRPSLLRLTRIIRNQRVDLSVSLTQLSAMATLQKKGPMSAGDLAGHERVQPPSMTKVLASLEEKRLVTREAHPTDKRQAIIVLTSAGLDDYITALVTNYLADREDGESFTTWVARADEELLRGDKTLEAVAS